VRAARTTPPAMGAFHCLSIPASPQPPSTTRVYANIDRDFLLTCFSRGLSRFLSLSSPISYRFLHSIARHLIYSASRFVRTHNRSRVALCRHLPTSVPSFGSIFLRQTGYRRHLYAWSLKLGAIASCLRELRKLDTSECIINITRSRLLHRHPFTIISP
jgi:hypothetical protein